MGKSLTVLRDSKALAKCKTEAHGVIDANVAAKLLKKHYGKRIHTMTNVALMLRVIYIMGHIELGADVNTLLGCQGTLYDSAFDAVSNII